MIARLLGLLALAASLLGGAAHAAISCSISSPGFAAAYSSTAAGANITQTYFTVTCTRGSAADPSSVSWSVKADNGLYSQGQRNRAASGGNRISYDVYKDGACGTQWKGPQSISGTINFTGTGTFTAQGNYWGCIPASQTGLAAGTYYDTVTMTMTYGATNTVTTGAFGVTITTPPTCAITTAPGTITFNYVSFGAAVNASTTFGVTCSLALPYTIALDATAGTIVGINYTLSLPVAGTTGTGNEQTLSIDGNVAAGQSGTCAGQTCAGTQARSVTVSY